MQLDCHIAFNLAHGVSINFQNLNYIYFSLERILMVNKITLFFFEK